jgi:SAM-dependent methyltransferase
MSAQPAYLEPYARAVEAHGAEFPALLWASPRTQAKRFDAMLSLQNPRGLAVLDLGCGRADLLDHMIRRRVRPARYVGIEGVRELAEAARDKAVANSEIIVADFVSDPGRMRVDADVIYCSGALNTLEEDDFHRVIRDTFDAARHALVFNFLASPLLAAAPFLRWRERDDVLQFARTLSTGIESREGYLPGDCTILLRKARASA